MDGSDQTREKEWRWNAWFYSTWAWRNCRALYIKSVGGLCERCLAKGLINPAE